MSGSEALRSQAFRLFEQGEYQACLDLIHRMASRSVETRIRIIEAVCLFSTGMLDEAEVSLRDLKSRVPDSAEVCLYLGRTLEQKGDEGARAEYAAAVRLDPDQPDAVRRYAEFLTRAGDHGAAAGLLRRLFSMTGDPADLFRLMHCHLSLRQPEISLDLCRQAGTPPECRGLLIDSLLALGRSSEVVLMMEPSQMYRESPEMNGRYLAALSRTDPARAGGVFLSLLHEGGSVETARQYISLLSREGLHREALGVWSTWFSRGGDAPDRIRGIPLLVAAGNPDAALEIYEDILCGDDSSESVPAEWYSGFSSLLVQTRGRDAARSLLAGHAASSPTPSLLLTLAGLCEETGEQDEARRYFFQAFRSDPARAGPAYASFLGRSGDHREEEKILGYLLKTVKKTRDLEEIAGAILSLPAPDPALLSTLNDRLASRAQLLTTRGRELAARGRCMAAESVLAAGSPDEGVEACLQGLAIVPVESVEVARSLFAVLISCKRQTLPDHIPACIQISRPAPGRSDSSSPAGFPWLDPVEEAVVGYLRKHRVCHELDLRKVAETRRVAGLMNRIMRKGMEHGVVIAEKDGYSEFGEVYRYAGP